MNLTTSEKIRIICKRSDVTYSELAKRLNMSVQNISNKLTRDNFTEEDLKRIAKALGFNFESYFIMEDGTKL